MPHSKAGSFDSDLSFDLLGPMNASSPYPTFSQPGTALSSSNIPSMQSNAWKRQSLPANNSYASLLARTDFDNLRSRRAGDRSSLNSNFGGFYENPARQRAQFYDEQFKYKDTPTSAARERVQRDSPIIAELRTNVIIKDEFTLVTDLSYHLATRYTRPDSAIMVKIDHSACLALAGTFDPCYILSITAVPSQMGPTINKRNAALIQSFMADILSVPPDRGIVKFESIGEENLAINGSTLLGEIERQEKQQPNDGMSSRRININQNRKSLPAYRTGVPKVSEEAHAMPAAMNRALERSRSTNGSEVSSPTGVFELPGEVDRRRPSTVHSHAGSERGRMNGVPNPAPTSDKSAPHTQERPKSRAGNGPSIQDQLREMRAKPMPSRNMPPPRPSAMRTNSESSRTERPPSFLKLDPVTAPVPLQQAPPLQPIQRPSSTARHSQIIVLDSRPKPRGSYLDGLTDPPMILGKELEPTITENEVAERLAEKKDTTANTAKRRSTITATPKLPNPPPIPSETTSAKSVKIGKRKSFLSAFRRSTAAH